FKENVEDGRYLMKEQVLNILKPLK
nr:dimethylaniline monooxygenase (N-oxide-forming) (EC 1.14.13.8), pulmonary - rabbit (fragments) [Oryctolagus cuniculus]